MTQENKNLQFGVIREPLEEPGAYMDGSIPCDRDCSIHSVGEYSDSGEGTEVRKNTDRIDPSDPDWRKKALALGPIGNGTTTNSEW